MQTQVLPATSNLALWREVSGERTKRRNREGIGRVIRQTRERRHMTVQTLARTLGQPVQAVANWESGVSRPEWEDVAKLSDALMHPVQAFLEVPVERTDLSREEQLFLNDYMELAEEERRAVDSVMQTMSGLDAPDLRRVPHVCQDEGDHFSLVDAGSGERVPDLVATVRDRSLEPLFSAMSDLAIVRGEEPETGEAGLYQVDGVKYLLVNGQESLTLPGLPRVYVARCDAVYLGRVTGKVSTVTDA